MAQPDHGQERAPVLEVCGLTVALPPGADRVNALQGVDLTLRAGEIHCVVGESGSGKSMTASAILGLLPAGAHVQAGAILLDGDDMLALTQAQLRRIRGARISMIFQDPMTALNPLHTVGRQIAETFRLHRRLARAQTRAKVLELLAQVGLPELAAVARAYPHELSGGQRQRAMIAMALALDPEVLIADEPTTALDVTTQAQILALIKDLQSRRGTAVLFITHDFGVVAEVADRVTVMQDGQVRESGSAAQVLNQPRHAYTRALIAAVPPPFATGAPDNGIGAASASVAPLAGALVPNTVLNVRDLSLTYRSTGFLRPGRVTSALSHVNLSLATGETLGVVGESGSGKSTLARCILRLLKAQEGSIEIARVDAADRSRRGRLRYASQVQMVFQDPYGSLNPRHRVGDLIAQGPITHGEARDAVMPRVEELLRRVGLKASAMDRYPHEFSGGQRQRIGLARALALRPRLLVADEPVSALDVSVQAQVLALLAELKEELGLSLLFITHDLRVAARVCDRVAVMRQGEVVELGLVGQVFGAPSHPYSKALLAAVPGRHWVPPRSAVEQAGT
ncbi:microcin ABC transporter ATP-binding protein [Bordetella genomosp. 10]|uniref:Microcin ABC transporter ATP-binding protein n=1 Tax=Bordetella genomosp. 10 TaxID=1416804 RepID=A0A261SCG7_9BORD|nr:ABC transporter ATP-binding protein [Bordetella genomosp. 10]OZI34672.1 microcin ABC transporter ATP-binding protein [Bordetella genomosp. 10]